MSWENPFQSPGRFWRGNIHTHSTASDGCLSPEAVCAVYKNAGYDFLCISDHFMERFGYPLTDATRFDTETFVTIRGAELHAGRIESGEPWHLLGIGLPADFAPPSPGESGPSMAARALAAGAFVAAAHPSWYRAGQEEIESLGPIHAVETWNATSAGLNDRPDSWYLLDRLVGAGGRYTACAGDDAHFTRERDDALRAWVRVKAEVLSAGAVVEALKRGAYYSSTGPELQSLTLDHSGQLAVKCSPAAWAFASGLGSRVASARGDESTAFELDISGFDSQWCRLTVIDRNGGRAWSNPIWQGS